MGTLAQGELQQQREDAPRAGGSTTNPVGRGESCAQPRAGSGLPGTPQAHGVALEVLS